MGWHPKVEMKAVWVQGEKSCLRIKGACPAFEVPRGWRGVSLGQISRSGCGQGSWVSTMMRWLFSGVFPDVGPAEGVQENGIETGLGVLWSSDCAISVQLGQLLRDSFCF